MTSFEVRAVERGAAGSGAMAGPGETDPRLRNWPVVYVLDGGGAVYVGETLSLAARMRQHAADRAKDGLTSLRVVLHDEANKSVCLDLESYLIRMFAGDGVLEVANRNEGVTDADYFDRIRYRQSFSDVFERLRREGMFTRTIPEILNSDLFKFSPFKALTTDQAVAVEDILGGLLADIGSEKEDTIVIQGDPGTGKTVVAIYLVKLLRDIAESRGRAEPDEDSLFSEFFVPESTELLRGFRIGFVVPQQSLRRTLEKVFAKTPGLKEVPLLTPFEVGKSADGFDLLIVDEAHRLNHRANQSAGGLNADFGRINEALFGEDDDELTQLDWIRAKSRHRILLLDAEQSVRPADLPHGTVTALVERAKDDHRHYPLRSQMRVKAGDEYVSYIRGLLRGETPRPRAFPGYDLRFFDDIRELRAQILLREADSGLSRLVAGYAWEWRSRADPEDFDIEIDGLRLRWNRTATDWVNSPGSLEDVGSIHTIQGYDLNYAGVVIGPDLRYDPEERRLFFDRANYFDKKGVENNRRREIVYEDSDILVYIANIYGVLLTRGILGTYVYVCDPALREHLRPYLSPDGPLAG